MHQSSYDRMKEFRDEYLTKLDEIRSITVLDIGSRIIGKEPSYRSLFERPDFTYTGMDIVEGNNVDIVGYDNLHGQYDVLISGQVMEHIERPWNWLNTIKDYYRHYICIIAPNTWRQHRFPLDCYRFFPDGMRALFDYAGIKEVKIWAQGRDTIGIGRK